MLCTLNPDNTCAELSVWWTILTWILVGSPDLCPVTHLPKIQSSVVSMMWLHYSMLLSCKYEHSEACPLYKFLMAIEAFTFLQSWNLQEPCVKLCFIWLLLLVIYTSLTDLSQLEAASVIPDLWIFVLLLKECTFVAIGKKALSWWRVLCIGYLEQHCLKQSFLTLPGSEIGP